MNKLTRTLGYISLSSLSLIASFNTVSAASFLGKHNVNYYLGGMIGYGMVQGSGSSSAQIVKSVQTPDTFATHGANNGIMFGLVGGVNIPRATTSPWFNAYQLETSIWQLSATKVTGTHTLPLFGGWQYASNYKLQLQALSLDGSVNIYQWKRVTPFVGAGIDWALATTNNYQETPQGNALPTALTFAKSAKGLFLYHARLGVRYQLPKHWQAQLAYTYYPVVKVGIGAGNTGVISTPGINSKVAISNLGLTLTYQF